jgi:hypothetical protein
VNLQLSASYEHEAARLLREAGLEARAERRIHDIAVDPGAVEPADVVVLHRVVCCYGDYERLLEAAGARARRLLVFSYPRRNLFLRSVIAVQNAGMRMLRWEYRAFIHPPSAMLAVLHDRGLRTAFAHEGATWQVTGLIR